MKLNTNSSETNKWELSPLNEYINEISEINTKVQYIFNILNDWIENDLRLNWYSISKSESKSFWNQLIINNTDIENPHPTYIFHGKYDFFPSWISNISNIDVFLKENIIILNKVIELIKKYITKNNSKEYLWYLSSVSENNETEIIDFINDSILDIDTDYVQNEIEINDIRIFFSKTHSNEESATITVLESMPLLDNTDTLELLKEIDIKWFSTIDLISNEDKYTIKISVENIEKKESIIKNIINRVQAILISTNSKKIKINKYYNLLKNWDFEGYQKLITKNWLPKNIEKNLVLDLIEEQLWNYNFGDVQLLINNFSINEDNFDQIKNKVLERKRRILDSVKNKNLDYEKKSILPIENFIVSF